MRGKHLIGTTGIIPVLSVICLLAGVTSGYELDEFGGWTEFETEATGFFRVDTLCGRWWLITPEGHPFYYLGINNTSLDDYRFLSGDQFEDVYGSSKHLWLQHVNQIAGDAGFTGWGGGCNIGDEMRPEMWGDTRFYIHSKKPFTKIIHFIHNWANSATLRKDGYNPRAERFPDVFSTEWEETADYRAELVCSRLFDNPYLMGYFVGSEPEFSLKPRSLWIDRIISLEAGAAGKLEFQACMESLYESVEDFNAVYFDSLGFDLNSFDELQHVDSLQLVLPDRTNFLMRLEEKFFLTTREKIEKYDPNHLILGARLSSFWACPQAIDKAAEHSDVLCFIHYPEEPWVETWNMLSERYKKPMIHVSFCFMGADTGFNNEPYPEVPTQRDRGLAYANLVSVEARIKNIVGLCWHSFYDHGDIWHNWGVVDPITTTVYEDMTDEMALINQYIYDIAMDHGRTINNVQLSDKTY